MSAVHWFRYFTFLGFLLAAYANVDNSDNDAEEIANVISGTYTEFNVTDMYRPIILGARLFDKDVDRIIKPTAEPGVCPTALELEVKEKKGRLEIELPEGLSAVDDDCLSAPGFEKTKVEMIDFSKDSHMPEMHLSEGEFYVASFPHTLLQCPGDKAPPFRALQLSSLKHLLSPKIRSTLRQLEVPNFVIDNVLGVKMKRDGPLSSEVNKQWNTTFVKRVVKGVQKELEELEGYFVFVLNRENRRPNEIDDSDPFVIAAEKEMEKSGVKESIFDVVRQLRHEQPNCIYLLGGAPADAEIKNKTETLVAALLPLFGHSRWSSMPIPSVTLYPTDLRCTGKGERTIKTMSLSKPPEELASLVSESDLVNWFTVSVNREACSSARMESVLEMDYHPHKSPMGLEALALSREIVAFLEEQRIAKRHGGRSPLRREYPDLAARLLDSLAKASIFAARIDLGACFQLDNRRMLDLLILRRPASFLYCNKFPRLGSDFSYNCDGGTLDLEREKSKQYSAFLVQKNAASDCVYSSSEFSAAVLRGDIAIPSPDVEESGEPHVIEKPHMDALPTLLPIV